MQFKPYNQQSTTAGVGVSVQMLRKQLGTMVISLSMKTMSASGLRCNVQAFIELTASNVYISSSWVGDLLATSRLFSVFIELNAMACVKLQMLKIDVNE